MPGIVRERLAAYDSSEIQFARRLKAAGLMGSVQYTRHKTKVEQYEGVSNKLKCLQQLQLMYPFRKFVMESDLEQLMKKWDMLMAPMERYIGEIPEKNLSELESYPWVEDDFKKRSTRNVMWSLGLVMSEEQLDNEILGLSPQHKPSYRIIAFPNQLNLQGLERKGRSYDYPKDPIIICELRHGICEIVTKWGPEANDPMLTNPILN